MLNFQEICRVDLPSGVSGIWKVEKFKFPEDNITQSSNPEIMLYAMASRPIPPGIYTRLMRWTKMNAGSGWKVIMSDTPPEIKDHYKVLSEARIRGGRVLINGLGLGMVLKGVLSSPDVTCVDVVENSPDVIKLVAPAYLTDPRVNIHQGDAYNIEWDEGTRWNVVWHDIWDDIRPDNLPEMKILHEKYKGLCDWQDSWCRFECSLG
jgi:hypothetical protein